MKKILQRILSILSKKRERGFSLIELLVVVTIIGVLAAVAIPAYNKYRVNAVQATITNSLQNIGKGFNACITLNSFSQCNDLAKIGVPCQGCGTPMDGANGWCVDLEKEAGGEKYKGCMTVPKGGGVPTVIGSWGTLCSEVSVTHACTTSQIVVNAAGCSTFGCSSPIVSAPTSGASCSSQFVQSCETADANQRTTNINGACTGTGSCN